jgi:hypothetical protein
MVTLSPPTASSAIVACNSKPCPFRRSISYPDTINSTHHYHKSKRTTFKSTSTDELKTILKDRSSYDGSGSANLRNASGKKTVKFDPKFDRWHNGLGVDLIPKRSRVQRL